MLPFLQRRFRAAVSDRQTFFPEEQESIGQRLVGTVKLPNRRCEAARLDLHAAGKVTLGQTDRPLA